MSDDRYRIARGHFYALVDPPRKAMTWAVIDRDQLVSLHLSEAEAESGLRDYKQKMADQCDHPRYLAYLDHQDDFGSRIITLECTKCGLVGELEIDGHTEIVWVGQQ